MRAEDHDRGISEWGKQAIGWYHARNHTGSRQICLPVTRWGGGGGDSPSAGGRAHLLRQSLRGLHVAVPSGLGRQRGEGFIAAEARKMTEDIATRIGARAGAPGDRGRRPRHSAREACCPGAICHTRAPRAETR